MDLKFEGEIRRMHLLPGDVVVIKCTGQYITDDTAARIREMVERICPANKCMVLDKNMDVDVLTPNLVQ